MRRSHSYLLLLWAVISCSEIQTPLEVRLPVESLTVTPGAVLALTGDTVRFTSMALSESGDTLSRDVTDWRSSDTAIAPVDSTGLVTARRAGRARITAFLEGAFGEADVEVQVGSGVRVPDLAHFDSAMTGFLAEHALPGATLAIARDGRLVLARGYGLADAGAGAPMAPEALFRVASVSKAINAVAVLDLVEDGRLLLDDAAFGFLDHLPAPAGTEEDPRLHDITVRDLLTHSAGWDAGETGFHPLFSSRFIAEALGVPSPPGVDDIIRYVRGQPLQFAPGDRFAYSNFGYAVLAQVIEAVTGRAYEEQVRDRVLAPAGIHRMRLARSREEDRAPGEVRYHYDVEAPSAFPPHDPVPAPYGAFAIEAMDGDGWLASAVDLVRFALVVDGDTTVADLLEPDTHTAMLDRPDLADWADTPHYYGLGWWVMESSMGRTWWHDGALPGSTALVVRGYDGRTVWAVLFNASVYPSAAHAVLWDARWRVARWPTHDLMESYP